MGKKLTLSFIYLEYALIAWFLALYLIPDIVVGLSFIKFLMFIFGAATIIYSFVFTIFILLMSLGLAAMMIFTYSSSMSEVNKNKVKDLATEVKKQSNFKKALGWIMKFAMIFLAFQLGYMYISVISIISSIISVGFIFLTDDFNAKVAKLNLLNLDKSGDVV